MVRFMHCINQLIKKKINQVKTSLQSIFAVNLGLLCRSIKIGLIVRTCLCFLLKRTLLPWSIHAQWPSCCQLFTSSDLCSFKQRPSPAHVFPLGWCHELLDDLSQREGRVWQAEQSLSSLCCFLQTSGPCSRRTRTCLHGATPQGRSLEKLRADEFDLLHQQPGFYQSCRY